MAGTLALLGRKLGMTRVFSEDGAIVPVTVVAVGPCPVIQIKTTETDGYNALQIGYGEVPDRKVTKPLKGHFDKAGKGYFRHLQELRIENVAEFEVGQELTAELFKAGESVKVTGTSKGKGFQGVMKRYHFSGLKDSHGSEKVHRSPGSIGCRTQPGKVAKNKKMPGHMGDDVTTFKNMRVVDVLPEKNIILIKGQVPGARGGLVMVRKQG